MARITSMRPSLSSGRSASSTAGLIAQFPMGDDAVRRAFERVEQGAHQFEAAERLFVVGLRIDRADIHPAADQIGGHFIGLGGGGRILERAGVGGNRDVDRIAGLGRQRQIERGDQIVEDLAGGRAGGIDQVEIAVFRVGNVVVDVEPELHLGGGVQRGLAEPRLGRGVERDGHLHLDRLGRRRFDALGTGQERQVVRQAVLIEEAHGFAHCQQRESERELGADRIAIRADVAEQDERLAGTQHFADLLEGGVVLGDCGFAHGVEPRRGARILPANPPGARINLRTTD